MRSLQTEPPGIVYHYADAAGLVGILQTGSGSLWASHHAFLNDPKEGAEFPSVMAAACQRRAASEGRPDYATLAGNMGGMQRYDFGSTWYVVCFSEHGDSLLQWRLYGADGAGYCLGFRPERLTALRADWGQSGKVVRVVYDRSEQVEIAEALVGGILDAVEEVRGMVPAAQDPEILRYGCVYAASLVMDELSATFKNPAYASEAEWRLVVRGDDLAGFRPEVGGPSRQWREISPDASAVRHRATPGGLLPYLPLSIESGSGVIASIRVGPRHDPLRGMVAARSMLATVRRHPGVEIEIQRSEHQYRGRG